MARIGGQELDFRAGAEGFLTKFAEGLANNPTRKALAQLKAKQAVEEAAKVNIVNRDILPYISNETERETIAEKLKGQEQTQELTPMQKKIKDAPAIAKVIAVKEGLGFVVIDAGSSKGIEKGTRFNIRRDKFIVAEVEINEVVDGSNSIGNIDADKKPPGINIREGDEVIGYPVF